jgi:hypothetical protein
MTSGICSSSLGLPGGIATGKLIAMADNGLIGLAKTIFSAL